MGVGRPPYYDTVDDIMPFIEKWEENVKNGEKPTITGLALALGFCEKKSVYDYAEKPEFIHPLKRCLLIVENGYEKALRDTAPTGSIFALKNMGWKDRTEVDQNTNMQISWHEEKTYEAKPEADHST